MNQYLELLRKAATEGVYKADRTGTGTYSFFGHQMRFNLASGFPLVTTKKCHLKSIIHELLWFLRGDTNVAYLQKNGVTIWDEWAKENGNLGPIYGYQWRSWPAGIWKIDQIEEVIQQIRTNSDSRRLIVSAWNVADIPEMALPPCHVMFQFYSREMTVGERMWWESSHPECGGDWSKGACAARGWNSDSWHEPTIHEYLDSLGVPRRQLSCQLYQRSADIFLGVPFNIASYALLTMMVAQVTGHAAGEFIWTGGDCHLYSNHIEQAKLQLQREPFPLPKMWINPAVKEIDGFCFEDFLLVDYQCHPAIKAPVAV